MAKFAMIMGKPIRSVGIKNPYAIKRMHPAILNNRNLIIDFIEKEIKTIKDAK